MVMRAEPFRLPWKTRFSDRCAPWKKYAARKLRSNQTQTEKAVWGRVRKDALGVRFKRQRVILGWIADFWCPAAALVVEIDGGYHVTRREEDARRDAEMNKLGIRVLRIPNELVEENLEAAIGLIRDVLRQRGITA
jgi:very-short-patch-repair endonuclease